MYKFVSPQKVMKYLSKFEKFVLYSSIAINIAAIVLILIPPFTNPIFPLIALLITNVTGGMIILKIQALLTRDELTSGGWTEP